MADMQELEGHIESTQLELQGALARLKGFAELQSSLDSANASVDKGGNALATLATHFGETSQAFHDAVGEFKSAIDAMREATPETLSKNVDMAVAATTRTEQAASEFQTYLKEELGEGRETLERRVHAIESGLEQTRGNIAQLRKTIEERLDDAQNAARSSARRLTLWVVLTLTAVLASGVYFAKQMGFLG